MARLLVTLLISLICLIGVSRSSAAESLRVSIGYAKDISEKKDDVLPSIVRDIVDSTKVPATYSILPFVHSMNRLKTGNSDVHFPIIYSEHQDQNNPHWIHTTATLWKSNFVLYVKPEFDVDIANLKGLKLVTDSAHTDLFDVKVRGMTDMRAALKMLGAGRIDGIIYAEVVIDPLIRELNLKNIKRVFYRAFDAKGLISKKSDYKRIDNLISKGVDNLVTSGELEQLRDVWQAHDNWQPYLQ